MFPNPCMASGTMKEKNKRGIFIAFEGGEGSGKTTQAKKLADYLSAQGREVLLTKEPGADQDQVCIETRGLLLNPKHFGKFSPRAEMFLFQADRAQHVEKVIKPALEKEMIVITDRYQAGTFAYQFWARGLPMKDFKGINRFATGGLCPDINMLFDIDPKIGLQRNKDTGKRDRFEMEDLTFHQKVREGFLSYFDSFYPEEECAKFNGLLSIEELHEQVKKELAARKLL